MSAEPVEITATRDESGWTSIPERIDPGMLSSLLFALSRLRADGILADRMGPEELRSLQLAPPAASFRVYGEGDEPLAEVEIGALRDDEWILARRGGDETIFQLEFELAEQIPVSLEAFRNRFAIDEEAADADAPDDDAPEDILSPDEESP